MLQYLYRHDYHDVDEMNPGAVDEVYTRASSPTTSDFSEADTDVESVAEVSQPSDQTTILKLLNNARVYSLADYYQIQGLKEHAHNKFLSALKTLGSAADERISQVIKDVYLYTPPSDQMRHDLLGYFMDNVGALCENAEFLVLVSAVPDFLAALLPKLREAHNIELSELKNRYDKAENHSEELSASCKTKDSTITRLKNENAKLRKTKAELTTQVGDLTADLQKLRQKPGSKRTIEEMEGDEEDETEDSEDRLLFGPLEKAAKF